MMTNKFAGLQIQQHLFKVMLVVGLITAIALPARMAFAQTTNLAAGKTATGSVAINSVAYITDGNKAYANYAGQEVGIQWIRIDLGQAYNLNQVNVWHYFGDPRTYHDVIVQVSADASSWTTVFNNDTNNSAGQGTGSNAEYAESSAGKTITFAAVNARYVRLWSNGSSANGYNHYVEVEVYAGSGGATATPTNTSAAPTATRTNTPVAPTATRTNTPVGPTATSAPSGNLAAGKTAAGSIAITSAAYITDGNKAYANYAGQDVGIQWIRIDLGQAYNLNQVNVWHYFGDPRTYHDVIVQVSADASSWTTVFNNDGNNSAGQGTGSNAEYAESSAGKTITFAAVNARYVRLWSNGSSANGYNHYVEVEVYAGGGGGATATNTPIGPTATRTNTPVGPTNTPTATATSGSVSHPANELFDDFTYTGPSDNNLTSFGWVVRNDTGGPGPANSGYKSSNVTFVTDPNNSSNKFMRMAATTNGTAGTGTSQAELDWNALKFREGTYATRFYFSDAPTSGSPDGDEINETFFTITPLNFDNDPAYSENDFEYLANGGWGIPGTPTMWNTTWETFQPSPWKANNKPTSTTGSLNGWHTLLMTVCCNQTNGHVIYYVDGVQFADHSGIYYPESLMSINYNIWYIPETLGNAGTGTTRTYIQQVDWLYFTPSTTVLTQTQVNALVADFRAQAIARKNNVP